MASVLESQIRNQVASAFRGRLLTCTLRRETASTLDSNGDPVVSSSTSYSFDGIRDSFSLMFAQAAGVPVTDARILIILGSLSVAPEQDDKVKIRSQWFQLRSKVRADPAGATEEWAAFEIEDPT